MNHKKLFKRMEEKFNKGKAEHKRGLENYSALELVEELLEEAIDTVFYCNALIIKLKEVSDETQEK